MSAHVTPPLMPFIAQSFQGKADGPLICCAYYLSANKYGITGNIARKDESLAILQTKVKDSYYNDKNEIKNTIILCPARMDHLSIWKGAHFEKNLRLLSFLVTLVTGSVARPFQSNSI